MLYIGETYLERQTAFWRRVVLINPDQVVDNVLVFINYGKHSNGNTIETGRTTIDVESNPDIYHADPRWLQSWVTDHSYVGADKKLRTSKGYYTATPQNAVTIEKALQFAKERGTLNATQYDNWKTIADDWQNSASPQSLPPSPPSQEMQVQMSEQLKREERVTRIMNKQRNLRFV